MTLSRNRIFSGLLAILYIIVAALGGGAATAFNVGMFVVLPLACIWFSEPMGRYVGPGWRGVITTPTPATLVCIAGWLLLLLPLAVWIVHALTEA
jgi:hypothetical protein